jgi:nicotinamidase-related amidase
MAGLELSLREIYHQPVEPGLAWREENFGYKFRQVTIPPEESALVLVDCWDSHFALSYLARAEAIMRERIRPVMDAARAIGVTVVHAPSPKQARKFPQWLRYAGDSEVSPVKQPDPDWPPPDFVHRRGEWAHLRKEWSGDYREKLVREDEAYTIHPSVWPEPDDFVIATGEQLHRLCKHRKIKYLFYAGFAANACLPWRDYGMVAMRDRGYYLILLRDCTTAIETADTLPTLMVTHVMVHQVELLHNYGGGGSLTSDEFIAAAQALGPAAVAQAHG